MTLQQPGVLRFAADALNVFPEAGTTVEVCGKLNDLSATLFWRLWMIAGYVSKALGPQVGTVSVLKSYLSIQSNIAAAHR